MRAILALVSRTASGPWARKSRSTLCRRTPRESNSWCGSSAECGLGLWSLASCWAGCVVGHLLGPVRPTRVLWWPGNDLQTRRLGSSTSAARWAWPSTGTSDTVCATPRVPDPQAQGLQGGGPQLRELRSCTRDPP